VPNSSKANKLELLRLNFLKELPIRSGKISEALMECCQPDNKESSQQLHLILHGLAGAAGTFGFKNLSVKARDAELSLEKAQSVNFSTEAVNLLKSEVATLQLMISTTVSNHGTPDSEIEESLSLTDTPLIYYLEDDMAQASFILTEMENSGYEIKHFTDIAELEKEYSVRKPDAMLLDMETATDTKAATTLLQNLKTSNISIAPSAILSVHDDFESRLAALRSGARRYIVKPANIDTIIFTLDQLTYRTPTQSYKALLVDDDPLLLEHQAEILKEVGIEVQTLTKPQNVFIALKEFKPDIVILDVYMPEVTGPEIAAMIRNDKQYQYIPILFLSSEQDMGKQLMALNLGGDDFITKPPKPGYFQMTVISRIIKFREQNHQETALKDTITNLQQTQKTNENLNQRLSKAKAFARIGFWSWDFTTQKVYWSEQSAKLLGFDEGISESTIENTLALIHPQDKHFVESTLRACFEHKSPFDIEYRIIWPNGETRWMRSRGDAQHHNLPDNTRVIDAVLMDIHSKKIAEIENQKMIAQLEEAQRISKMGSWHTNYKDGTLTCSDNLYKIFDLKKETSSPELELFYASIHPEDKDRVKAELKKAAVTGNYDVIYRIITSNCDIRYIHELGQPEFDEHNEVVSFSGTSQDVTEIKKAEKELNLFKQIIESSQQGIGITNSEGIFTYCNQAHENILGYSSQELIGQPVTKVFKEEDLPELQSILEGLMQGKNWQGLLKAIAKDKHDVFLASNLGYVSNQNGQPEYLFNIFNDYGPEKQRQEEIILAKESAESANQAKSEFLSSMSHELRTPLNSIIGFSDLLLMISRAPQHQDYLNQIKASSKHLLDLINDILDFTKIDSGKIGLSIETIELFPFLNTCLELTKQMATQKSIDLKLLNEPSDKDEQLYIKSDLTRTKQVILNFISNAIKYNEGDGVVEIFVEKIQANDTPYLRINIKDYGMGIPEAYQNKVFEPFNRLGREVQAIEGTGIGLSICRTLAEAMGGEIGFTSVENQGSTFWLQLPEAELNERAIHKQHKAADTPEDPQLQENITANEKNVLYIEDNEVNIKLMTAIANKLPSVKMTVSKTAEEGIEKAKEITPDLILLDINLPGMNGDEALPILKKIESLQHTKMIALSANAMQQDIDSALEIGFDDYMTKPLQMQKVISVLTE